MPNYMLKIMASLTAGVAELRTMNRLKAIEIRNKARCMNSEELEFVETVARRK